MNRILVWVVLNAVINAPMFAQAADPQDKLPTFESGDHKLVISSFEIASQSDLTNEGKSKHTLAFAGYFMPAPQLDVVAVNDELKPVRVEDADGRTMLPQQQQRKRTSKREPLPEDFTAVVDDVAATSLPKTQLASPPWLMQSMDVQSMLIVAKNRQEQQLPAVVMEDPVNVAGVELRIDRLSMSEDRKLMVSMRYERRTPGPIGAFVEAVYALDAKGKPLGGGRWTDGTPFSDKGKLTFIFPLTHVEYHHAFRVVVCTAYEMRTINCTVTGPLGE